MMTTLRNCLRKPLRSIAFMLLPVLTGNFAHPQTPPARTLVLSHQTIADTQLLEIEDKSKVRLNIDNQPTSLSFDELCRWGTHPIPQRFPMAILVDGSCLAITSIERQKDQFVLQSSVWEDVRVPESMLRAVVVSPAGDSETWFSLVDRVTNSTGRNDQLLIGNRGWIDGILQWPEVNTEILQPNGSQQVRINNQDVTFPVKEIDAILFSPVLTPMTNPKNAGRMGWKDGSLLVCSQWRITQPGDSIELTLHCGLQLKSLDHPAILVQSIASLSNRPQSIRFLSDMEASSYKHVDWLTTKWPLAKDRDLLGRRLMLVSNSHETGTVEKGLAMHATSQAAYRWDKSPSQLLASVGLATPTEPGLPQPGQAVAKVLGLKAGKLEPLYTSPLLTADSAPENVSVSLEGVELIVLIVDAGPGGTLGDHVLWLDIRIQK